MTLSVRLDRPLSHLYLKEFPNTPLNYRRDIPQDDPFFLHVEVTDSDTQKTSQVCLKWTELQGIGFSLQVWNQLQPTIENLSIQIQNASFLGNLLQKAVVVIGEQLNPEYKAFFQNTPFASRTISLATYVEEKHSSKLDGVPGMYFHPTKSTPEIFINLKKTAVIGKGSFGKIRKVLWLTAPNQSPQIVAKKVLRKDKISPEGIVGIQNEIETLYEFSEKRGIISIIAGGYYEGKWALFLPIYECDLISYLKGPDRFLTLEEKLSVTSQWIEGLATLSKRGIHGDLSSKNLLLKKKNDGKIEAVISDFGTFRLYEEKIYGLTTPIFAPPEYYTSRLLSSRQDVWAMGISLRELFSKELLPSRTFEVDQLKSWISTLPSNWISEQYPTDPDTPPFLSRLIIEMLAPNFDSRPSVQEVFDRFSIGYSTSS